MKVWRPRMLTITSEFSDYLRKEGLELKAVHVLETDENGVPTKAELELGPACEADSEPTSSEDGKGEGPCSS